MFVLSTIYIHQYVGLCIPKNPWLNAQYLILAGLIDLLRYFVDNCLKTNEQKAACNSKKDSVFHVLIRSGKANTTLGETILRLLLNHGFKPHQKDIMGRLPIQYLRQNEQAYALISKFMSISGEF